jgi:outer membrane immunogenic protein
MKKLLLGTVALVALGLGGTSAMAADMPVYKAQPLPVWTWAGVYFGAHGGGAWGDSHYLATAVAILPASIIREQVDQKPGGWVVGGQAGARWQWGGWVVGVEATLAASDIRANDQACGIGNISAANPGTCIVSAGIVQAAGTLFERDIRISNLYTATAQVGWAFNRTLWYVKGGYAGGQVKLEDRVVGLPNAAGAFVQGISRQAHGWTVGTGIEYLVLQNLSLGIEYDYIRLGFGDTRGAPIANIVVFPGPQTYQNFRVDIHQVVARANYRLDWGVLWGAPAPAAVR